MLAYYRYAKKTNNTLWNINSIFYICKKKEEEDTHLFRSTIGDSRATEFIQDNLIPDWKEC